MKEHIRNYQLKLKKKFGNVKDVNFRAFEKFEQEDRVTYLATFDKQPVAAIIFVFDKNQKFSKLCIYSNTTSFQIILY